MAVESNRLMCDGSFFLKHILKKLLFTVSQENVVWGLLFIISFPLSFKGHVVMGTQAAAVHQQVIERTKGIMYKTQAVIASIDKKLASQLKQPYTEPFTVCIYMKYVLIDFVVIATLNSCQRKQGYNF